MGRINNINTRDFQFYMMSHLYSDRLDAERNAIRTVTLVAGSLPSRIRCLLKVTSLNAASYKTISYAWGDHSGKSYILVEDRELQVPRNLEVALTYLRKPTEDLELWVDAICINQDDEIEKAHQVKMMGEIFRHSTSTYIWLGVPGNTHARNNRKSEFSMQFNKLC